MSRERAGPSRRAAKPGRANQDPRAATAPAPAPSVNDAGASPGAGRALWLTLALLAAARLALAFVPDMWMWGLNLQRFLAPALAWSTWAVLALALVPALARGALPALEWVGDRLDRRATVIAIALLVAVAVWQLPDRTWFTGDFLMRAGTVRFHKGFLTMFPQSMPLDALIHDTLPRALAATGALSTDTVARALGALEAGALAVLAIAFARALGLGGAPALAAALVVACGGALTMLTGYAKSAGELALLTAWVGLAALGMVREGRGALSLGIALALAPAVHRSGLLLFPAGAAAWLLRARPAPLPRGRAALALALPLASLALLVPRIAGILSGFDAQYHFGSPDVRAGGGLVATALAGTRPVDLVNAVIALAPLSPLVPVLAITLGRRAGSREALALLALAVPLAGALLVIHPQQGLFRDWDVFTTAGVALSLLAACWIGRALAAPGAAWLAVAVAAAALAPTAQWLAHDADFERGLQRAEAFVREAPRRSDTERGKVFDYLGDRNAELTRWSTAARLLREGVEIAPSPRMLTMWALAETENGNRAGERDAYRALVARNPGDSLGWQGLGAVCAELGDSAGVADAARALARLRAAARGTGAP